MTRTLLALAVVLPASMAPLAAGCGGGGGGGGATTHDAGPAETGPVVKDAGGGKETSGSDGLPDGGVYPHGTQLVQSQAATLLGVTSDGYAIYTDSSGAATTIGAVPLAGGTPKVIGPYDGSGGGATSGSVAVYFNGIAATTGVGTMAVWTAAHGAQTLSTSAPAVFPGQGFLDVSKDGAYVLFYDNTQLTASGATGDLTVIGTDGSNKKVLLPGVQLPVSGTDYTKCPAIVAFAGDVAIVAYCPSDPTLSDAGANAAGLVPAATIATFAGPSWTAGPTISTSAYSTPFSVDSTGTFLTYAGTAGQQVAPLTGGTPVVLDPTGVGGTFTSDGKNVVYLTAAGGISTAPSAGGTPTALQTAGFAGLLALSPDGKWLLAYQSSTTDQNNGVVTNDVYLASATTAGTATTLASGASGSIVGDPFTADSSHALYLSSIVPDNGLIGVYSAAAASGGSPAKLGSASVLGFATSGAKVVFNQNWLSSGSFSGTADVASVDTSGSAAPTVLVSQADQSFFVAPGKTSVVYSWSYVPGDSRGGIWTIPIP